MNLHKFKELIDLVGYEKAIQVIRVAQEDDAEAEARGTMHKEQSMAKDNLRDQLLTMLLTNTDATEEEVPANEPEATVDVDELATAVTGAMMKALRESGVIPAVEEAKKEASPEESTAQVDLDPIVKKLDALLGRIENLEGENRARKEAASQSPVMGNDDLERFLNSRGDKPSVRKEADKQDSFMSAIDSLIPRSGGDV